jgi:hypothetical protein
MHSPCKLILRRHLSNERIQYFAVILKLELQNQLYVTIKSQVLIMLMGTNKQTFI